MFFVLLNKIYFILFDKIKLFYFIFLKREIYPVILSDYNFEVAYTPQLITMCAFEGMFIMSYVYVCSVQVLKTCIHHPLKCVQWGVLLGGALGRMFGGSPQFLFVIYRPDRRENVRS